MICLLQTKCASSIQEWYETSSRDAGRRTRQLRKLGYKCWASHSEMQVTPLGLMECTLVTIDTYGLSLERYDAIPTVEIARMSR